MTGPGPRVSVCIANYQGEAVVCDCIDSVLAQREVADLEVIVHDDASPDGSADLVASRYPGVTLLRSAENVGFCLANNRMAEAARGEYLLLLNNDAALLPGALAQLLEDARRYPDAILTLPQYDRAGRELLDCGMDLDLLCTPAPRRRLADGEVATVMGACLWVPAELWRLAGGFPAWFGSIAEDLYLCQFARLAGRPVRALGRSGYRHEVGRAFGGGKLVDGRIATSLRRRTLSERNRVLVACMVYPQPFVAILVPLILLVLLVEGSLLSLLRWDRRPLTQVYSPALAAPFREWSRWRPERARIQGLRRVRARDFFRGFRVVPVKLQVLWRHGLPRFSGR